MKKLLAILLAAVMLLGCMAFTVAEDVDHLLGDWYLQMMAIGDEVYNAGDIGMIITLTIREDGTCVMDQGDGEPMEGTWEKSEDGCTLTIDEDTQEAAYIEDYLIIADEIQQMTFGRELPTPSYVPAAPVAVEDVAAFEGTWKAAKISMEGMFVDASMMESDWEVMFGSSDTTIVIKDGAVTVFGDSDDAFALTAGILLCDLGEGATMSIILQEDGVLCYDYLGAVQIYCEKAE